MVNLVPSLLWFVLQIQVPWALTLGELKNPPAGYAGNTWITFLPDLFFEIPNLARFLSDDSKSPVPLSNLLTSPRVTQKPEKDAPTTFYRENDIRRRSVVKNRGHMGCSAFSSKAPFPSTGFHSTGDLVNCPTTWSSFCSLTLCIDHNKTVSITVSF